MRAFVPTSQIDVRFVEDPAQFVGQKIKFRVTELRGGNAILSRRALIEEERAVKAELKEQSVIAYPIEAYGERIGAIVISQFDPRRNFSAEDLEFAASVAERIGAASHIHRLARIAQEGHRAAEELARREVDARVRFETVLETAPVGVAVVSADELRFELANARFLEFAQEFGKLPLDEKVIGLRADDVIPGFERTLKQVAEAAKPGSARKLDRAPTLVVVSARQTGDPVQDREDLLACGVAAYIVLLAAHARGLAGYWRTLTLLDEPAGREAVRLGADEIAVGLIHLGWALHPPQPSQREPLDTVVTRLD